MLNKRGKSFMQPMKACLPWLNSYRCHRYLYARLWKYLSSYCNLVHLCLWILFMWYRKMTVSCMFDLVMKELFELTAEVSSRECRVNLLTWDVMWLYRTGNIFWDNVTEQIYILAFGLLLMEGLTEIEHILRPAHFWDCTQHRVVISFGYFGITSQSYL